MSGYKTKKLDRTGSGVEVHQFDHMDGSGRVTLRNRKFLRKFVLVYPQKPSTTIDQGTTSPHQVPSSIPTVHAMNSSIEPLLQIPDIDNPNEQLLVPADSGPCNIPALYVEGNHTITTS